jgi:flagellar M-ring protein FliF
VADQQILSPDGALAARSANLPFPTTNDRLRQLRGFTEQPAVKAALPAIGLTGAVGLAAIAWMIFHSPAQAPLFQGLSDGDKSAVADALKTSGLAYTIDRDSGTVEVNEDEVARARIMLAGQGLPKAAPAGDAVLAALPMGASRAVEGETLRGARETNLARTIEAIDTVKSARVHLATPEPSVFVRDLAAPAASIMLTLQQGRTLSEAQVRAIRHLVASSVPGLSPDQVEIVDQSGSLLSQLDNGGDDRSFQLQVQIEDRFRKALAGLLIPIVGRENYSVEVHADVDMSESQSTRETYPKDDKALRREEGNRSNANAAPTPAAGIPGALSNQPPPASQLSATPPASQPAPSPPSAPQSAETYTRSFDVGREISVIHKPQGHLSRLTVAVALRDLKGSKPRNTAEITALENLVKGAVGFDATRGDIVAISSRSFVEIVEPKINFWDAPWFFPLLRQLGAMIVALMVLLMFGRPMLKKLRAALAERAAASAALEQQLLNATGQGVSNNHRGKDITLDMIESAPSYEARALLVRQFVRQDSERAALVVRQLMRETADE